MIYILYISFEDLFNLEKNQIKEVIIKNITYFKNYLLHKK